jgi:hypothetical protein
MLSQEELDFIKNIKVVPYCVDPRFMPYEQINSKGNHEGVFYDFLSLVANKTGIEFQLITTTNYKQSRKFFK